MSIPYPCSDAVCLSQRRSYANVVNTVKNMLSRSCHGASFHTMIVSYNRAIPTRPAAAATLPAIAPVGREGTAAALLVELDPAEGAGALRLRSLATTVAIPFISPLSYFCTSVANGNGLMIALTDDTKPEGLLTRPVCAALRRPSMLLTWSPEGVVDAPNSSTTI